MAGEFERLTLEIWRHEPELLDEVHDNFLQIVDKSYNRRPGPHTKQAIRDRLDCAAKWFQIMRRDVKWSRQRIYDHLVDAVVSELDDVTYTIPREHRGSWASDNAPLIWTPGGKS
jgi:hypothetical protein